MMRKPWPSGGCFVPKNKIHIWLGLSVLDIYSKMTFCNSGSDGPEFFSTTVIKSVWQSLMCVVMGAIRTANEHKSYLCSCFFENSVIKDPE